MYWDWYSQAWQPCYHLATWLMLLQYGCQLISMHTIKRCHGLGLGTRDRGQAWVRDTVWLCACLLIDTTHASFLLFALKKARAAGRNVGNHCCLSRWYPEKSSFDGHEMLDNLQVAPNGSKVVWVHHVLHSALTHPGITHGVDCGAV